MFPCRPVRRPGRVIAKGPGSFYHGALFQGPAVSADSRSSPAVRQVQVTEHDAGQRLDNFLARHLKGVPRTRLYRIIRRGEVRINGSRGQPSTRLQPGDVVRVPPVRVAAPRQTARPPAALADVDSLVLYQDRHLLVIDKPAGVAVHGGSGIPVGVIEALKASPLAGDYLELGHRLDRDTSGCLVMARSRPALEGLHRLFRRDDEGVDKRYLALLAGAWRGQRERVALPLLRVRETASGRSRVRVDASGQASASDVETRRCWPDATLVEIRLLTGRMHQARVHCAALGHPVLGDDVYGDFAANRAFRGLGLSRLFLHASTLSLPHPVSGQPMRFSAPLDGALEQVLAALDATADGGG